MRFVCHQTDRGPRAGLVRDERVLDVWDELGGGDDATLDALLRSGRLEEAGRIEPGDGGVPLAEAQLLPPLLSPSKIIGIGMNYAKHAAETGRQPPTTPTFFPKWRNTLSAPGAEVRLPRFAEQVDYEAEVAFVVGRRCKDVPEADALSCLAGYTLLNDLSARDLQYLTPQWGPGKTWDGAAPCGPALVTPDEVGPPDAIDIGLELNGETMQSSSTADLVHSVPALVAYLSKLMTLEPGDIVSTGTPEGVGMARKPPVWLKPGDTAVVVSSRLGRLETRFT
jgi:2-keto-4-pentenoate hydratase/2-oxohepta-3-ene-1,7-dioic acid hydratase in catechol pathway